MLSAAAAVQRRSARRLHVIGPAFGQLLLFGAVPATLLAVFANELLNHGFQTFDFNMLWHGGSDVLHGRSPYPSSLPDIPNRTTFRPFVYPAPAAVALAPVALIPYPIANVLWAAISVAAIVGTLRLLDVRDWRCYGAAFAAPTVCSSIFTGTITPLLVLGCAALWRFRSRALVAGVLLAALVVLKLYLWPVAIWMLVTRRWRAVMYGVAFSVAALAGWAAFGLAGLRDYARLLNRLTTIEGNQGCSVYALARSYGASDNLARDVMFVTGAAILAALVLRVRRDAGDEASFVLALGASLVLTPIVWPHYFALTCVACGVASRRLGPAWIVPIVLWPVLPPWSGGDPYRITIAFSGFVLVFILALRSLGPARADRHVKLVGQFADGTA